MERAQPAPGLDPCPDDFSLTAHVLAAAADRPDRIALMIVGAAGAERWSYGRLARAVGGISGGLNRLGLGAGERVLLRIGNSVDFPLAFLGAVGAGLLPVACPAALTEAECARLASDVDAALVIAGPGISLPPPGSAPVLDTRALRDMAEGAPAPPQTGAADRPAYLVYTSGTSGQPRAVLHAHRAVWARRSMQAGWHGLAADDRLLHAGALNWTFTLGTGLFDPWVAGATALIPSRGITPSQLPLIMRRHDVTILAAAPAIIRRLLRDADLPPLPRLRRGLAAGERLAPGLAAEWERRTGTPLLEAYGLSECSTFISSATGHRAPDGWLGYPQPGRRVALIGTDGVPGDAGVIAVHRDDPGLFLGYWGAPAETSAAFGSDWFLTGDLGERAPDGALRVVGRVDDMMNAGGLRVSPLEVEAAMADCPGAGDLAVTEIALGPGRSIIAGFYTGAAAPESLAAHAAAGLAAYKCPRAWRRLGALPVTANGKINRRALRASWTGD